jgi:anti-anti-sigma factor
MPGTASHRRTVFGAAPTQIPETPEPPRFSGRRRRSLTWRCPHPSEFAILVVYELHDVALHLSGALDTANKETFDECVRAALADCPRRLVLELSALELADGVGVSCFVEARSRAEAAGVDLILDSPNVTVRQLLDHRGVTQHFRIR